MLKKIPASTTKNHLGFSLIELMVTLAVLAIIIGYAAPQVANTLKDSRITSTANNLAGILHMAHNEAVMRNKILFFCATADTDTCQGNDYSTAAVVDNGILHKIPKPAASITITASPDIQGKGIQYRPNGTAEAKDTSGTSGAPVTASLRYYFHVQDERGAAYGRTVCLGYFGQTQVIKGISDACSL